MPKKTVALTDKERFEGLGKDFAKMLEVNIRRCEQDARDFSFNAEGFKAKASVLKEVKENFESMSEAYCSMTKEVEG